MTRLRDPKLREAKVKLEEDIRDLIENFKKEHNIQAIWFRLDPETSAKFSLRLYIDQDITNNPHNSFVDKSNNDKLIVS